MKEGVRVPSRAKLSEETNIEIPVTLYGNAIVKKNCSIGAFTFVNSGTSIYSGTNVGKYCSIGKNCEIGRFDHPTDWLSTSPFQYNMKLHFPSHAGECHQIKPAKPTKTIIGNDVWIGSLVIIKRGITIGNGAIISAGAVVIDNIPPYAIVGGVPAKVLKYRFDDPTIENLTELKWWELTPKQLQTVQFDDILIAIKQIQKIKKPKKEMLNDLQKATGELILKSQKSAPLMTFEEINEIITSQLLEADISDEAINEIMSKNKNMNRDYDKDEYIDHVILNHKIVAVTEIVFADKQYEEVETLSLQAHKKIMNILRDKH